MKNGIRELKFVLLPERAAAVSDWLRNACLPEEPHAEGPVSSVYFDTPDWRHLREKTNSDYLKSKFRIRWYHDQSEDEGFAEVKRKIGALRSKKRLRYAQPSKKLASTGLDDAFWLDAMRMAPGLEFVPEGPMFPSLRISYHRQRFIEPTLGLRLNLDCNIAVTAVNPTLLPLGRPVVLPSAVFEAKGEIDRLPPSLYPITQLGGRRRAYSKYLAGWLAASNRATL